MRWLAVVGFPLVVACGSGYQPAPDPGPPFRRMELIGLVASHTEPPDYAGASMDKAEARIGPTTLTMVGGRLVEVPAGTPMSGWCWKLAEVRPGAACTTPCWLLAELDRDRRTARSLRVLNSECLPPDHQGPPSYPLRAGDGFGRVGGGYLVGRGGWGYPLPSRNVPVDCPGARSLADIPPGQFVEAEIDPRTGLVAKVACLFSD